MKSMLNEIKNILDEINSRLDETKEWTNDLEDRVMKSKQTESLRKGICKMRTDVGNSMTPTSAVIFTLYESEKKKREKG